MSDNPPTRAKLIMALVALCGLACVVGGMATLNSRSVGVRGLAGGMLVLGVFVVAGVVAFVITPSPEERERREVAEFRRLQALSAAADRQEAELHEGQSTS